ncbi:MAG: glycine/betaine ABC transporter substrate-binding protein, partial [Actinomycetota bacterium]|nr:glycine/betaine ABC transporter substrate-binding protein [Actinomycetota bacterium]
MQRSGTIRAVMAVALALMLTIGLAACGNSGGGGGQGGGEGGGNPDGPKVVVGSKNFTEQFILGELYAQALQAKGFNVEKNLNLGSEQIADRALQSGQIDMYPEYTGTALVSTLKDKEPAPDTPEATYERAKELYAQRDPANTMLTPADFNNSYGIVVVKEVAQREDLKTLDDLAEASPNLRFATYSEFQNREDGFPNLKKQYPAFDFKDER